MASLVDIYNTALGYCGVTASIASVSEGSLEADLCERLFPTVRDNVMSSAAWPRLRAWSRLASSATRDATLDWTSSDPDPGYVYSFLVPSDMLHPLHLNSYYRFSYANGKISCNQETPILHYLRKSTDPAEWDTDLAAALSAVLAVHIVLPLTGRDARLQSVRALVDETLNRIHMEANNGQNESFDVLPTWIAARGYSDTLDSYQYFYPLNTLNYVRDN